MNAEFEAQLSAYLDGELSAEDEARMREAIAASPELARRLAELESVDAALAAVPTPAVPAGAQARLRERIATDVASPRAQTVGAAAAPGVRAPRRRSRVLAMAAAVAAAALLAWLILPRAGEESSLVAEQPAPVAPAPSPSTTVEPDPASDRQVADGSIHEAAPEEDLPDLLAPEEIGEDFDGELDPEDVAVVEVLEWLAALEALEPDEGRG
ncbi:MAG: hypothetical protein GY937_01140 [bacterium]|nr:hypothetical protein [bacterium]